jgi:PPOX class probable F420-dependent enzyme
MTDIDESTPGGAHAARLLREAQIGWITTVRPDGQPQSSPVWFHWDGSTALTMSQPTAPKLANLRANPRLSLHLDSDGEGGGIVTAEGTAEVLPGLPDPARLAGYRQKYDQVARERLHWTPEELLARFSVGVLITPARWRVTD